MDIHKTAHCSNLNLKRKKEKHQHMLFLNFSYDQSCSEGDANEEID